MGLQLAAGAVVQADIATATLVFESRRRRGKTRGYLANKTYWMTVTDQKPPSTAIAVLRGALGRCPCCGQGRILHHYLKVVDKCSGCGEAYGHFRADDAPPWLTILVVGHITIPVVLALEQTLDLAMWVELAIYLPLIALLTLAVLPRCKGVILALLWAMKAEGSEKM